MKKMPRSTNDKKMRWDRLTHHRIALAGITLLLLCILGSSHATAQQFQYVYGSPGCSEAAHYGVTQVSTGGYIAAGETFAFDDACMESDIYVVRTNIDGTRLWAFAYNIGTIDSATDIIEDANGDFVICGVTTNGNGCPVSLSRDAFILKINAAGAVIDARTFGTVESDEIVWNIIQTTDEGYVMAGSTTFADPVGLRDAYLIRTDSSLNLIWDAFYGGPGSMDEYFYGLDQIQADASGDIVAVGATNTVSAGSYDVLIMRVGLSNGMMSTPAQNLAIYGGAFYDEGLAIVEIDAGPYLGTLVVTGLTLSRPAPSTSFEILMLHTLGDPCVRLASAFAGDDGAGLDGGMDLKLDMNPLSPNGDVIVTGFTSLGDVTTFTPPNAFLQRFALGTMLPSGGGMLYGGDGLDVGWSVDNVTQAFEPETPGYIVSGFTQSPNLIGGDPEQLYLIKTDVGLSSGCNEMDMALTGEPFLPDSACAQIAPYYIGLQCSPKVDVEELLPATQLCYFPMGTRQPDRNGNDGVSGVESLAVISFTEGTVTSYPNPVPSGTKLNLRFDLKSEATAHISVSNIVGEIVHTKETKVQEGSAVRTIETAGWPSGSYIVRIEIGGKASTTRIVVLAP